MKHLCSFIGCLFLAVLCSGYKSYTGYEIIRSEILNPDGVRNLKALYQNENYDFLQIPRQGDKISILVAPEHATQLKQELAQIGIQYYVSVSNVQSMIENEKRKIEVRKSKASRAAPDFDRFLTFDEISAYITEVSTNYSSIASLIELGTSTEGRPLRVLKLSNGPGKRGIWFDAGIHAREWISPPVALYTIYQLTENLAQNQAMLDNNDFYFLPVTNPDGYDFTWTQDRFWRKTRNTNEGSLCIGTDANRNFDLEWESNTDGPCSNTYAGLTPLSTPEAKSVADFLTNNPDITFYVALHSHGRLILMPWSWTTVNPPHYDEMKRVGNLAADAIQAVQGTVYDVGSSADILYYSYGNSKDWAYGGLNITYSYTVELPPGGTGFDPPPEDILPVVTETWEAIKVFAANIPNSRG